LVRFTVKFHLTPHSNWSLLIFRNVYLLTNNLKEEEAIMLKKVVSLVILISFINLIMSCSTTGSLTNRNIGEISSSSKITANKLPEIQLTNITQKQYKVKLLSLEAENLTMLSFPYWDADPVEIHLEEIHSIKVMKKDSKAGKGFGWGFALGFLIPGTIGGLSSEYDEDYQDALVGSIVIGLFGGLLGLIIGGVSSLGEQSQYNFSEMSESEKINSIKEIMGSF